MRDTAYTPANPSSRAVARVLNPLPPPTVCPHCGLAVLVVNNAAIYGKPYGDWPWAYRCEDVQCDSFVGMHPLTNIPLGTLAKAPTRKARNQAKHLFNPLWRGDDSLMTRSEAYAWLAEKLAIPAAECHFGLFDIETCKRVIAILKAKQ